MSSQVQIDVRPLIASLAREIKAIDVEAALMAHQAAEGMAEALRRSYPNVTGDLVRGIRVQSIEGGYRVRSTAPHTHLLEYGTRPRVNYTRKGANRGRMTPNPRFVSQAVFTRQDFVRRLQALLDRPREL